LNGAFGRQASGGGAHSDSGLERFEFQIKRDFVPYRLARSANTRHRTAIFLTPGSPRFLAVRNSPSLDNWKREFSMPTHTEDAGLAREVKALVALAFRNGPIEGVCAGKLCPTCNAVPEYSGFTDDEMKAIMKSAVNRLYALLRLKNSDPDGYAKEVAFGARYTGQWDEPEDPRPFARR
jgi:hypothetical protein